MADATGTPTSLGIPKYNTAVDAPSGKGNASQMDAIDALLVARIGKPAGIVTGEGVVWNGTGWDRSSVTRLGPSSLGSGAPDATKVLAGDGSWQSGMVRLADSTATGAVASFDFSGLPVTFAHLMVVLYLRGDAAVDQVTATVRFNNDATAVYLYEVMTALNNVAPTSSLVSGQTSGKLGSVSGGSALASTFGVGDILVPHYAQATGNKTYTARMANVTGANGSAEQLSGRWGSSAAINRVTVLPSSGNFVAGSRVTIYGLG